MSKLALEQQLQLAITTEVPIDLQSLIGTASPANSPVKKKLVV